jgi:hypothetical protein
MALGTDLHIWTNFSCRKLQYITIWQNFMIEPEVAFNDLDDNMEAVKISSNT